MRSTFNITDCYFSLVHIDRELMMNTCEVTIRQAEENRTFTLCSVRCAPMRKRGYFSGSLLGLISFLYFEDYICQNNHSTKMNSKIK